jgi:hypothetical protein
VKRTQEGPKVIAIAAGAANQPAPEEADEIHVHVVERIEALAFAHHDLRVLIEGGNVPGDAPAGAPDTNVVPFNPRRAA